MLRRSDRRDRIHLQEAEAADSVEHAGCAPVEELRTSRDTPCPGQSELVDGRGYSAFQKTVVSHGRPSGKSA